MKTPSETFKEINQGKITQMPYRHFDIVEEKGRFTVESIEGLHVLQDGHFLPSELGQYDREYMRGDYQRDLTNATWKQVCSFVTACYMRDQKNPLPDYQHKTMMIDGSFCSFLGGVAGLGALTGHYAAGINLWGWDKPKIPNVKVKDVVMWDANSLVKMPYVIVRVLMNQPDRQLWKADDCLGKTWSVEIDEYHYSIGEDEFIHRYAEMKKANSEGRSL